MKYLLPAIALLLAFPAISQTKMSEKDAEKHMKKVQKSKEKGDILWDYDTVFNKGVPYCIVYEVDKGALQHNDYSVRSLTGQELIYVKYATYTDYSISHAPNTPPSQIGYYSYYFTDTKNIAETSTFKVYKEVVKNDLISNGQSINSDAENKFIALNGRKYSQMNQPGQGAVTITSQPTAPNYTMVNRNRTAGISIFLNSIKQDGQVIGSIQTNTVTTNGTVTKTMSIFLANGTKVAEATASGATPHNWSVVFMQNNYQGQVVSTGDDNMDVIKYLISNNYL